MKDRLRVELQDILSKWQKPVLLVTHNRDEAYELCDTLAIMERGSLCEQGQTKELFDNPRTRTGALLTGCKNICAAKNRPHHRLHPCLGIELDAGRTVGENLCAIGIRASHFSKDLTENRQAVQITGLREEPYRYLVEFRFLSQKQTVDPSGITLQTKVSLHLPISESNRPISTSCMRSGTSKGMGMYDKTPKSRRPYYESKNRTAQLYYRASGGHPRVSIYMPTHRQSPDNKQDPILYKNSVAEAKKMLEEKFSGEETGPILQNWKPCRKTAAFGITPPTAWLFWRKKTI